ncbi:DUF3152 domain-containing protein [Auraticoccus sp. F435]|uniref:DUF3152 domain-containing protein n=1 Tax=Auraticoccus cholistanensis TaxID=2656650 RepID=A0A6A9UT53_9ACTN|nr:DUF3152 domain-containing protein [Auraticoccus cholistanensis]
MTEPTDTPPAVAEHPTRARSGAPGRARPRRSVPRESNFRLWVLVAVLLLVLPLAILGVRGISAAQQAGPAPAPDGLAAAATASAEPTPGPEPTQEPAKPRSKPKPEKTPEPEVPARGPQEYVTVDLSAGPTSRDGELLRYRVRIEENLALDPEDTATEIADVLGDERSWRGDGSVRFQLVGPGEDVDFTIYVVTPGTTDALCAPLRTNGEVSCRNGDNVVLNAKRWVLGAKPFGDDLTGYRQYLVNHEVGHRLGYDHVDCPAAGEPAPIMMQQTKSVGDCEPHPWVKPGDR